MQKSLRIQTLICGCILIAANVGAAPTEINDHESYQCGTWFDVKSVASAARAVAQGGGAVYGDLAVVRQPWESPQPGDADYVPSGSPPSSLAQPTGFYEEDDPRVGPNERPYRYSAPPQNSPSGPPPQSTPYQTNLDPPRDPPDDLWGGIAPTTPRVFFSVRLFYVLEDLRGTSLYLIKPSVQLTSIG
jgi:hypothetical protein